MEEARYPRPGTELLGKYVVESVIGVGGMGAVLKARHRDLDDFVAIKCLLPEQHEKADIVARFLREAKAVVRLKNPHVARVFDVGKLPDGMPYIVMEYLDGPDLSRYLKRGGPLAPGLAVDLLLQACEAIAEAHSIGVIHRDIKASNVVIVERELKVLDFGIATAPEGTSDLTTTDSVFGTPAYMAPEQMRQARVADERSDIWSLGVVLYECLEGRRPFRADSSPALVLAVGMDPPEPMVLAPEPLRPVILRCLEKSPDARFQTVAQLAEALQPHAGDATRAAAAVQECVRVLRRSPPRRSRESLPDMMMAPTVVDRPQQPTSVTGSAGEIQAVKKPRRATRWVVVGVIAGVTVGGLAAVRPWNKDEPSGEFPVVAGCQPLDHVVPGDPRPLCAAPVSRPKPPPDPTELFELAGTQRARGDYDAAVATLEKARAVETNALARQMIDQTIADVGKQRDAKAMPIATPPPAKPPRPANVPRKPSRPEKVVVDPFAEPAITKESVTAKFLSVKRGYEAFKAKNGSRLEPEWIDLQIFLQSLTDDKLVEASNRIEAFRLKVREALVMPGSPGSATH